LQLLGKILYRVTRRYPVFMTSQHTDISDLSVVAEPAPQVWLSATTEAGLDGRLEIARLDSGRRVAVRDSRFPGSPALLFTAAGWQALLGPAPELVDLR
jgi:Domain of unknown function (DUF397)